MSNTIKATKDVYYESEHFRASLGSSFGSSPTVGSLVESSQPNAQESQKTRCVDATPSESHRD